MSLVASASPVLATVPPEVPHQRNSEIFAPFFFAVQDDGESVFTAGGPACQRYPVFLDLRQKITPTSLVPASVGLPQFIQELATPTGLLLLDTHGDNAGAIAVEAFPADDEAGFLDAQAAIRRYTNPNTGIVSSSEITYERVIGSTPYWNIVAEPNLVTAVLAEHGIVFGTNCHGTASASAFVNSAGRVRDYLGFTGEVNINSDPWWASDGTKVAQTVFNNMAGIQNTSGAFGNLSFAQAVGYGRRPESCGNCRSLWLES